MFLSTSPPPPDPHPSWGRELLKAMLCSGSWPTLSLSHVFIAHVPHTLPPSTCAFAYLGNILFLVIGLSGLSRLNKISHPFCVLPFFRLQMMSPTSVTWVITYLKTTPALRTTSLGKVCILSASRLFGLLAKLERWWFSEQLSSPLPDCSFCSWSFSIFHICIICYGRWLKNPLGRCLNEKVLTTCLNQKLESFLLNVFNFQKFDLPFLE